MPKTPKADKTEKVARPFNPCQCFSIFAYDIPADAEDDTSETVGRAYGPCGETTQADFRQGHDAKLKSVLISCHRDGMEYGRLEGAMLTTTSPMLVAQERGWEHFLTPGKPKAPKAARKAKLAKASPTEKLDLIANMKLAATKIKDDELVDPVTGDRLHVSTDNWSAILDGSFGIPKSERGLDMGSHVNVTYRGRQIAGTVVTIEDEHAKVAFTTAGGKDIERVFEIGSLTR